MEGPIIRLMKAVEAETVAELLVRANEEHLSRFPPAVASAYRTEITRVAHRLSFADVYVAELGGRLVGSVTYLADAADDGHPWPAGGAVLRLLAVDAPGRRRGVGERLTTTCIERARRTALFLGLHTAPQMAAARRIYERLGFERAPEHDFDPAAHYGGVDGDGHPWGLAYVLRFDDQRWRS